MKEKNAMDTLVEGLHINKRLFTIWAIVTVVMALVFLVSAPFELLLGDTAFAQIGTIHGMLATVGVIFGTATGYFGWRLFAGRLRAYGS